ncbi:MAG TPA: transketolase [Candidatus Saccharimonadales bacterium]|jgi:transketolase|nr:transketolase [Candidatus Saccharimonadales bacterium]
MSVTDKTASMQNTSTSPMDMLCINTIRTLSIDAVQAANSGHPGTPMGMAPVAYCLWQEFLRYDPNDPVWPNRDRFVLSAGHASMLLYSLLHLAGVKEVGTNLEILNGPAVRLEDIKNFRQLGSRCPGHPESHLTTGVETTTGPLGQGYANSVGMALAGKWLASRYNQPGFEEVYNYNVYALGGDGCMMEGVSSEAASLAGHLKLSNLCWIYDSNRITIEGGTPLAFDEDVAARFAAYGWNVTHVTDANDLDMVRAGLRTFLTTKDRPTLIIVNSHIGYGSPHRQDTKEAHGEALGEEEVKLTKRFYGWPEDAKFLIPGGVYEHFQKGIGARGKTEHDRWTSMQTEYRTAHADLANEMKLMQYRELPTGWDKDVPVFPADAKGLATRDSSNKVENAIAKNVPWLIGGAADLAPSTKTLLSFEDAKGFQAGNYGLRNMHFGIREHGMGGIINGMAQTKLRAFGSTFFVFTDYMRGAMRLSALMQMPVIYILTHDSLGVGEDGPTHQPIEHLAIARATPGMLTLRPADANEVAEAWKVVMPLQHQPALLVLTRQALPTFDRTKYAPASGLARGAYVLAEKPGATPDVLLLATGSEVSLCVEAYEQLAKEGIQARVVSMPSWDLFEKQDQAYRDSVLPPAVKARVSVEMATVFGWDRYVGASGDKIGMHSFGASAPIKPLQKHFGFTVENVVAAAKEQIQSSKK